MPRIVWNLKSIQVELPNESDDPETLREYFLNKLAKCELKTHCDYFIVYTKSEFERKLLFIGRRDSIESKSEWKLSDKVISIILESGKNSLVFLRTGFLFGARIKDLEYERVANCLICNNEPHCNGPCTKAFTSADDITIINDNVSIVPLNPVVHCGHSYSCGRNMLTQRSSDITHSLGFRTRMHLS